MTWVPPAGFETAVMLGMLTLSLLFKPWLPLAHRPLQSPWLGCVALLPFVWWTENLLPNGMALHVSGACLLVLMFGWPLAMWTLLPIALAASYIEQSAWPDLTHLSAHIVWMGMLPGTLSLLLGLLIRRFLPQHLFVYILGRGFFATALAVTLSGALALFLGQKPETLRGDEWMLGYWLLGWGEAVSTGMLTSIFVAFLPDWLLTYSDGRYLPGASSRGK